MESVMQEASRGTGPTWEQWRWESDWLEADAPFGDASTSRRVNVADFKKCVRFSSPRPNQFSTKLDQQMTYRTMLLADHIYCLCVRCDMPLFPSSWAGHVSMVDAVEADKCMQQARLDHFHKATTLHKLAVWAARDQHHRTAMILEEDFTLPNSKTAAYIHVNYKALEQFIRSDSWDFLRFGHMPWNFLGSDGRCTTRCRVVRENLSRDVWTPGIGCDIRSSVAYMVAITDSIVDRLLDDTRVIDCGILQKFKQSYIMPAIIHQKSGWHDKELENDASFRAHCSGR